MAKYAIEDTTLTSIGDAVRKHVGETREEIILVEDNYYKFEIDTDNPDDWAKFTPRNPEYLLGEWTYQFNYIFRNAYNYKVVYNNAINDTYDAYFEYAYSYISVYNPETESGNGAYMIQFDRENLGSGVFITEHNDRYPGLQIYCCRKNEDEIRLNISLEVYALDENGNVINEETITVKNTMTPMEMAEKINELDTIPDEAFNITGDCSYRFGYSGWDWFINLCGNKITTSDISNAPHMFYRAKGVETIPFELNFDNSQSSLSNMFDSCLSLKEIPKINNASPSSTSHMFSNCESLKNIPEDIEEWFDWNNKYMDNATSAYSGDRSYIFDQCKSLRSVPMGFLNHGNPVMAYTYSIYNNLFTNCYSLDEVIGLPFPHYNAAWKNNVFSGTFKECYRLKEFTFKLQEDGTPYSVNWKSQTIDLSKNIGYASNPYTLTSFGFDGTTRVLDDATYQAIKDNPDYWTNMPEYSRYNHDSAVRTINSLPIITATGTNTIKFNGAQGSLTDGGAINTLTEAEIAVATAKG